MYATDRVTVSSATQRDCSRFNLIRDLRAHRTSPFRVASSKQFIMYDVIRHPDIDRLVSVRACVRYMERYFYKTTSVPQECGPSGMFIAALYSALTAVTHGTLYLPTAKDTLMT